MRKSIKLIIVLVLAISMLVSTTVISADSEINYKYREDIRNISIKHDSGIILHTDTSVIEENGKKYKVTTNGINVSANIKIKDAFITGTIKYKEDILKLEGKIDEENGKYTGLIINKENYTFEAFIVDIERGDLLINVFDEQKSPTSYLISDRKSTCDKKEINNENEKINNTEANSLVYSLTDEPYYQELANVSDRGMSYKVEGPNNVNPSSWYHQINIKTKVDDAYADSGVSSSVFFRSGWIIKNDIKFTSNNSNAVFAKHSPSSNSSTSFSFPFYFGQFIGIQTVSITTSTTSVTEGSNYTKYAFTWGLINGYLDENTSGYSNKSFGGKVVYSVAGTGSKSAKTDVYLQYHITWRQSEFTASFDAYPSYSNTNYYYINII